MIRSVDLLIEALGTGVVSRGVPQFMPDHEVPGPPLRREGEFDLPVVTPNTFTHFLYQVAGCYQGLKSVENGSSVNISYSYIDFLTSIWGLFAGVNSNQSLAFKSAASFEAFTCENPDYTLDALSRTGRGSPMLQKKFNGGLYRGFCKISIERLQFINLSDDLWYSVLKGKGINTDPTRKRIEVAMKKVLKFLSSEYPDLEPDCELGSWVKTYSREKIVHKGIKFNSDAVELMIRKFISWVEKVYILKPSGEFFVTGVLADYNSTAKSRVKFGEHSASTGKYFDYYEKVEQ